MCIMLVFCTGTIPAFAENENVLNISADNILLDDRIKDKLILTPHIAGITNLTVQRIYKNILENINRYSNNQPLINRII